MVGVCPGRFSRRSHRADHGKLTGSKSSYCRSGKEFAHRMILASDRASLSIRSLIPAELILELTQIERAADMQIFHPGDLGKILDHACSNTLAITGMMRSSGKDPRLAGCSHIRQR